MKQRYFIYGSNYLRYWCCYVVRKLTITSYCKSSIDKEVIKCLFDKEPPTVNFHGAVFFTVSSDWPKFPVAATVSILDSTAKNDPTTISLKPLYDFVKLNAIETIGSCRPRTYSGIHEHHYNFL